MSAWVLRSGWIAAATLAIFVVASTTGIVSGGPLDPPGPPAPTMKTLSQVEPRIPISQPGAFPMVLSSGSYYFTENIQGVPGQDGIVISGDNVTIDLNGFAFNGGFGSGDGVTEAEDYLGLVIRNGTVSNWVGTGILLPTSRFIKIDALNVLRNGTAGIDIGREAQVSDCLVTSIAGFEGGVHVVAVRVGSSSLVADCTTRGYSTGIAVGDNSRVSDCVVSDAFLTGIYAASSTIERCKVANVVAGTGPHNGIMALNSQILHNSVTKVLSDGVNNSSGINVGNYSTVAHNTVTEVTTTFPVQSIAIDVVGTRNTVHDNDITQANKGIRIIGETTVSNNRLRLVTTPFDVMGLGNDVGPTGTIASVTSPFANIVD